MSAAATKDVIVYRARNLVNGHSYIGVTKQGLAKRELQHRQAAARGAKYRLHRALRKYGDDKIVFEVMLDFMGDYDLALAYEYEAIEGYKPEYNMCEGGAGRKGPLAPESLESFRAKRSAKPASWRGKPLSEAHKAAIAAANRGQGLGRKGIPLTEEQKQRLRLVNLGNKYSLGHKMSDEAKEKIGAAHRGRVHLARRGIPRSDETKQKLRAANEGRPSIWKGVKRAPEIGRKISAALTGKEWIATDKRLAALTVSIKKASDARKIPVACLNDGKMFSCADEAAEFYGTKGKLIRQSIRRGQSVAGRKFSNEVPK